MTRTGKNVADEADAIVREMLAIGRGDLARKARKLRDKALAACLADYYAGGPGAAVLRAVRDGGVVTLRAETRASPTPGATPPPKPGRKPSIWETLAARLGREPTNAEACAEVRRILADGSVEAAERGGLPHQRGRFRGL